MTVADEPQFRPVVVDPSTIRLFSRPGPQCQICSAWTHPCEACRRRPVAVIAERRVSKFLRLYANNRDGDATRLPKMQRCGEGARKVLQSNVPTSAPDRYPAGHHAKPYRKPNISTDPWQFMTLEELGHQHAAWERGRARIAAWMAARAQRRRGSAASRNEDSCLNEILGQVAYDDSASGPVLSGPI
jgi:hypothetical protein